MQSELASKLNPSVHPFVKIISSELYALINFLNNMKSNWSISIFHYRNYGADVGKIVIGVLIDRNEIIEWHNFVKILGYKYWDETKNDTYKLFLGASD